jgi:hypothetical protein
MGANKITGLADPTADQDAVTKKFLSTYYLPLVGGTLTDNIIIDKDGLSAISLKSYANSSVYYGYRAGGTKGSPSATAQWTIMSGLYAGGYSASGWSGIRGQFAIAAAENFTDAAQGTYAVIQTTPTGSTTMREVARFAADGKLTTIAGLTIAGAVTGVTTQSISGQLTSTLAGGTSPFAVTSTTVNTNLNADLLDGNEAAAFLLLTGGTMTGDLTMTGSAARQIIDIVGSDTSNVVGQFGFKKSKGTYASPTAVSANDQLGRIYAHGYYGGATPAFDGFASSDMVICAGENHSDVNHQGTYIMWRTTANGAAASARAERMRISSVELDVQADINSTGVLKVDDVQVVGNRVVDARCDDTINTSTWDSTTAGVLDSLRDAMITHGLLSAA